MKGQLMAALLATSAIPTAAHADTMLFLHGMISKYDRPKAEIEDAAREYATRNGWDFEAIETGDDRQAEEKEARSRIERGGIAAVYGFSMGGYTAEKLKGDYPHLRYVNIGAPGTVGDIEPPGDHMAMPAAMVAGGPAVSFKLDQKHRGYKTSGTVTLRDPDTHIILGTYHFVSGGFGRGSSPLGLYAIGAYRDETDDPLGIGQRWMVRELGREDGEVFDSKINDVRNAIEIHGGHHMVGTLGCFGIDEPAPVYERFKKQLHSIISKLHVVTFNVLANPNGADETAVAAYEPLRPVYRHREHAHGQKANNRRAPQRTRGHHGARVKHHRH